MTDSSSYKTSCCITGGGPAGMMLGYLLARSGVSVTILEKHKDFLRDFRGDTVHPSTIEILDEIGLLSKFDQLPQNKVQQLGVNIGGEFQRVVDFRGLKPIDYLSFVPQWDFLNLLASEGKQLPNFDLRMQHEVVDLIKEDERIIGVRVKTPEGELEINADLVIACDGRHSTIRKSADMKIHELGAPMDVLWFRLPRTNNHSDETFGTVDSGQFMVLLNRDDYWQAAYVVPKGSDEKFRSKPIKLLQEAINKLVPFLADSTDKLQSWDDVKTLEVKVDRLEKWYQPGLLLIGDAAHAMSPVGGIGINLAIQDAVAAANVLAPAIIDQKPINETLLHQIQKRRLPPTKLMQFLQLQVQKRMISKLIIDPSDQKPKMPAFIKFLLRFRLFRQIPARIIGYGFRREHVRID